MAWDHLGAHCCPFVVVPPWRTFSWTQFSTPNNVYMTITSFLISSTSASVFSLFFEMALQAKASPVALSVQA